MKIRGLILILTFIIGSTARAEDSICEKWFKKSGIDVKSKSCLLDCAVHSVDLGTFSCHDNCEEFCKVPVPEKVIFEMVDLYPGLTPAEKAIAAKEPQKTLQAFYMSYKADLLCAGIFDKSGWNDESDACRHFLWAAFMTEGFGQEFTLSLLNAHEQIKNNPPEEKAMDEANNRYGILKATDLIGKKEFSDDKILKEFEKALEKSELSVLKPKKKNKKE